MPLDVNKLFAMATSPGEIMLRLGIAILLGMCIGLDREWRRKPAGIRTHMMVSLASASLMILAEELHAATIARYPGTSSDPLRILEAVTAGVAFLGAGAIIQGRGDVRGMTTGASIWLSGAAGLACGAGFYVFAAINVVLALIILTVVGYLSHRLMGSVEPPAEAGRRAPGDAGR